MNDLLPRLKTDFNSADENEAVVLIEDVQIVPRTGEWVRLVDVDGNSCEGTVADVVDDLIYVNPLWQTWREADTVVGEIVDLMEALRIAVQQALADRAGDARTGDTEGRAVLLESA